MGKFADRLAWLMGWDILSVDPHKCHGTQEWAARLSLPREAEFEMQRIAQEQERQAKQPQLSMNGGDRLQLPASEPAIADPSADTEGQMKAIDPVQPLPLSLVDLLEAMLEQPGELLLSQVEAIVSKPRFQQAFPHLGQVNRAALIAAFRQLEAQEVGKVSFLTAGQAVLKHNSISVKTALFSNDRQPLSKPAQIILNKVKNKHVQHEWLDAKWVRNYVFYTKELRQYSQNQIRGFLHELAAAGKGIVEGEGGSLRWCFEPNRESSTQN